MSYTECTSYEDRQCAGCGCLIRRYAECVRDTYGRHYCSKCDQLVREVQERASKSSALFFLFCNGWACILHYLLSSVK